MEDLVLKVIAVYFLYFVFDNISFKNSAPFSSKLNLMKKAVTLVVPYINRAAGIPTKTGRK